MAGASRSLPFTTPLHMGFTEACHLEETREDKLWHVSVTLDAPHLAEPVPQLSVIFPDGRPRNPRSLKKLLVIL